MNAVLWRVAYATIFAPQSFSHYKAGEQRNLAGNLAGKETQVPMQIQTLAKVTAPLVMSLAMLSLITAFAQAGEIESQPGYTLGEFIYEEAPFPSCHASTLADTSAGVVAAWFGGTDEKDPDVGIWFSRQLEGEWTNPVEVANGVESPTKRYPCWNPVLFQSEEGPLLLFYKVGPSPSTWWGMLITSSDHGKTWSEPQRLPEGFAGPIKNKPVRLADGDLLCPTSSEHAGWRVHMERTSDLGKTWSKTLPLNDGKEIGAIQPSILFHSNNLLQALGRSRQDRIWQAWSNDAGKTWGPMTLTDLPNPNSGTDAVTLSDGRHLLVYNHTTDSRSPLNVAISEDGKAWRAALVLEDQPGEYSYPAVIQASEGAVHITYTWKRELIKHVVVDLAKLRLTDLSEGAWPESHE